MAAQEQDEQEKHQTPFTFSSPESYEKILSKYLGISFAIFLGSLPKNVTKLQTQNEDLNFKLIQAEEELKELYSRRKEDSKANARVVEIFASHRHGWQQEEKRLLQQIDESAEEIAHLRGKVEDLEKMEAELKGCIDELRRDISERDEMLNFMSRRSCGLESNGGVDSGGGGGGCDDGGECYADLGLRYGKSSCSEGVHMGIEECFLGNGVDNVEEMGGVYGESNGYSQEFLNSSSKFWSERPSLWQDMQYESLESQYNLKHFVSRRESPWKVDGESTGVSSKLKLLEQELLNLERVGKPDLSKLPSVMRKQAKRYQALVGKIEDLCQRMQANDPCEPTLTSEFRTQRQTEFLLEAFRLQQRASETAQKLVALQSEAGKSSVRNELKGQAELATRRSLDSIRNNFREIQRNLEIWLARIIGDLEGILARDGASRTRAEKNMHLRLVKLLTGFTRSIFCQITDVDW